MYRIYFNRKREWPQIWSIDEGDQVSEINVKAFRILVPCQSASLDASQMTTNDHENRPCAWIECEGVMTVVEDGVALIYPRH
jgi:hypothetical protein